VVEDDELVARSPEAQPDDADPAHAGASGTDEPDDRSANGEPRNRCPTCGTVVDPEEEVDEEESNAGQEVDEEEGADEEEAPVKSPWHFKVLVVGTVVYLGYRLYQGIGWLIHHA